MKTERINPAKIRIFELNLNRLLAELMPRKGAAVYSYARNDIPGEQGLRYEFHFDSIPVLAEFYGDYRECLQSLVDVSEYSCRYFDDGGVELSEVETPEELDEAFDHCGMAALVCFDQLYFGFDSMTVYDNGSSILKMNFRHFMKEAEQDFAACCASLLGRKLNWETVYEMEEEVYNDPTWCCGPRTVIRGNRIEFIYFDPESGSHGDFDDLYVDEQVPPWEAQCEELDFLDGFDYSLSVSQDGNLGGWEELLNAEWQKPQGD